MKLDPYLTPYANNNNNKKSNDFNKCMKDLNVRAKVTKLIEENIGINLHDLGLGSRFLNMI